MCSCEPSFTCPQCVGTPFDPAYFDFEPRELRPDEWDALVAEQNRRWSAEWSAGV